MELLKRYSSYILLVSLLGCQGYKASSTAGNLAQLNNIVSTGGNGTSDGAGGGSTAQFGQGECPFLLDLLSIERRSLTREQINQEYGDCASESSIRPVLQEVEPLDSNSLTAFNQALGKLGAAKLRLIEHRNRVGIAMILDVERALNGMSFMQTSYRFSTIADRLHMIPYFRNMQPTVVTSILYLPQFGAIISRPVWDDVGVNTRAGLMIHEAIRQIQGAYGSYSISDRALQTITAYILTPDRINSKEFDRWLHTNDRLLDRWQRAGLALPQDLQTLAQSTTTTTNSTEVGVDEAQRNRIAGTFSQGQEERARQLIQELVRRGILVP